jgi:hypothetical protein
MASECAGWIEASTATPMGPVISTLPVFVTMPMIAGTVADCSSITAGSLKLLSCRQ